MVERSWFIVHDYQIHLSDVGTCVEGRLVLSLTQAEVEQQLHLHETL